MSVSNFPSSTQFATFPFFRSEYYFSPENLQKDFFIRRNMDADGYLPVSLIASFRRVQALTTDITFIVQAVENSDVVETKNGIKVWTERVDTFNFLLISLL